MDPLLRNLFLNLRLFTWYLPRLVAFHCAITLLSEFSTRA